VTEVLVHPTSQPDLAAQLRIAAQRVWRQLPLGVRFKIAVHRMLAQIYKGVGEAIVIVLADHGFEVPRDDRGRVDLKDPAVTALGKAIYDKIRGVIRNEAGINDVMQDTFEKVFLRQKTFLRLRGKSFSDYRGWILTAFHNAARTWVVSKDERVQQRAVRETQKYPNRPKDRLRLEILESQLLQNERVPWERHPMWRQVKTDVFKALADFDRREKANRPPDRRYDFPTKRVFELMVVDGLSANKAAVKLSEEGVLEADPSQVRHALKRLKTRLDKVVQTVVSKIQDRELLDSFFDTVAAA